MVGTHTLPRAAFRGHAAKLHWSPCLTGLVFLTAVFLLTAVSTNAGIVLLVGVRMLVLPLMLVAVVGVILGAGCHQPGEARQWLVVLAGCLLAIAATVAGWLAHDALTGTPVA